MQPGERFGYSVAVSNTVIAAGSSFKNVGSRVNAGMAHMISLSGDYLGNVTANKYVGNITVDDTATSDWFGSNIACTDTHFVVAGPLDDEGASGTGSAYHYEID